MTSKLPAKVAPLLGTLAVAFVAVGIAYVLLAERPRQFERTDAAIERSVLAAYDQMTAAAERIDTDALFQHVRDNDRGALVTSGRLLMTRGEALAETRRNFEQLSAIKYRFDKRHVTVLSADAAIVVATAISDVTTTDGRNFSAPFVQTVVMVRDNTGWKVLHTHQSSPPRDR